jgi:hypothetical protein
MDARKTARNWHAGRWRRRCWRLAFDAFRAEYNHERHHEALGQTAPAGHYKSAPMS